MTWLLIGYMWLFVYRPFEIWPVLATYRVERVYMIVTILYWLASRPSLPRRNRLHWCFAAFVLAMLASWFTSPYREAGEGTVEYYLRYVVFYVMLVTSVRDQQNLKRIVVGYIAVMAMWMMHSLREYYCGNQVWAQYLSRLVPVGHTYDFNDFAGLIVCSLPLPWRSGAVARMAAAGVAPRLLGLVLLLRCPDVFAHGFHWDGLGERVGMLRFAETLATACHVPPALRRRVDNASARPKGTVPYTDWRRVRSGIWESISGRFSVQRV